MGFEREKVTMNLMKQLIVVAIFGRLKFWRIRISAHMRGEESHLKGLQRF